MVDLLMQITADALSLELFIYQENGAQIQIIHFTGVQPMRTVRLKFKHDNLHPLGNHYQSIIEKSKTSKKCAFKKPNVKKECAGYGTKTTPLVKKEHPGYGTKTTPDVIDLTQDDDPFSKENFLANI